MGLLDSINDHLSRLPESEQAEVFDFVSFLEAKKNATTQGELEEWSSFSLETAMAGITDADEKAAYSTEDIKESYL